MACVLIGAPLFYFAGGVMEQNQDLFADDHASLGQLVDRLDQIPTTELTAKWPKALAELVDVLACELVRGGWSRI